MTPPRWSAHARRMALPACPASYRPASGAAFGDGLPRIAAVPGRLRAGLSKGQLEFLLAACDGRHVRLTAPGGAGKTMALCRYAEARQRPGPESAAVLCLTPDDRSSLRSSCAAYFPHETGAMLEEAGRLSASGRRLCLVVDEYVSLSARLAREAPGLFDQVVLTGDDAQSPTRCVAIADEMSSSGPWTHCTVTTLWRSSNPSLFDLLNGMAYGGRYEAFGTGSDPPADSARTRRLPAAAGQLGAGLATALRIARNVQANRGSQVAAVFGTADELVEAMAVLSLLPLTPEHAAATDLRFMMAGQLHGTEADIIVASGCGGALGRTRDMAAEAALTIVGRPRYRLDLCLGDEPLGGPGSRWLPSLLSHRVGPRAPDGDSSYDGLAEEARRRGLRVVESLNYLSIYDAQTGRGLVLVNVAGTSAREAMRIATAAAAKRWKVATRLPGTLSARAFDPSEASAREILALAGRSP